VVSRSISISTAWPLADTLRSPTFPFGGRE